MRPMLPRSQSVIRKSNRVILAAIRVVSPKPMRVLLICKCPARWSISSCTTTKPTFAEEKIVSSNYAFFAHFAQTWGLVYFVVIFLAVLVYALLPSRQKQFDDAARMP